MKRFLLAIALACVLSGSALAGDGHTVGAPAPEPPPPDEMGNGVDDGNQGTGTLALLAILDLIF